MGYGRRHLKRSAKVAATAVVRRRLRRAAKAAVLLRLAGFERSERAARRERAPGDGSPGGA